MSDKVKDIVNVIGKVLSLLSIVFIIVAICRLGFDFNSIDNWSAFIVVIIVGAVIKSITVFVSGSAWADWIRFFSGKSINMVEATCVYAKANIGKYLPGNVMHYVERNIFAQNMGVSQKKLMVSTILEIGELVITAFLLSFFTSYHQVSEAIEGVIGTSYKRISFIIIAVLIIVISGIMLLFWKKISKIISEYSFKSFMVVLLVTIIKYAFELISLGCVMALLFKYMGGNINWYSFKTIVSGYIIAWVIGFITPGASGGIGVREIVVVLLLGNVVGKELVLTLSVIHRLITIIGDFMAYFIRLPIQWKMNKKN